MKPYNEECGVVNETVLDLTRNLDSGPEYGIYLVEKASPRKKPYNDECSVVDETALLLNQRSRSWILSMEKYSIENASPQMKPYNEERGVVAKSLFYLTRDFKFEH